jgi:ribosomal protein L36
MWNQLFRNSRALALSVLNNQLRNVRKNFSILSSPKNSEQSIGTLNLWNPALLQSSMITITAQRGMKQVGNCKRRCKDCYYVVRQERLFVMCKTHPRHKQMSMKKRQKNTWILTDATQSIQRAW